MSNSKFCFYILITILKEDKIYNYLLESFNLVKKEGLFLINFSKLKKNTNLKILKRLKDLRKLSENFERGIYKINFYDFLNQKLLNNFFIRYKTSKVNLVNEYDFLKMEDPNNFLIFFFYGKKTKIRSKRKIESINSLEGSNKKIKKIKSKKNLISEKIKREKKNFEMRKRVNLLNSKRCSFNNIKKPHTEKLRYSILTKKKKNKKIIFFTPQGTPPPPLPSHTKRTWLPYESAIFASLLQLCLEDPGKARDCFTNTTVVDLVITSRRLPLPDMP